MNESLDPTQYVRIPRLDVAGALSLSKMLLALVPKAAPPPVKRAAKEVRARVNALENAWRGTTTPERAPDVRPIDRRLDNLWAATDDRLAHFEIFGDDSPKWRRARAAREVLFPAGLGFLKLAYVQEHAESQKRLDLIAQHKLEKDLNELVGPEFIERLRATHEEYGRALGITAPLPAAQERAANGLTEPLRAALSAISAYALQVLAYAGDDPGANGDVKRALAPIDQFREASRRATGPSDVVPPEAPTPTPPV